MPALRPLQVLCLVAFGLFGLGFAPAATMSSANPAAVESPTPDSILARINARIGDGSSRYGTAAYQLVAAEAFAVAGSNARIAIYSNEKPLEIGPSFVREQWILMKPDGSVWQIDIPLGLHHRHGTKLKRARFRGRPCVLADYWDYNQDVVSSESTYVFHDGRSFAFSSRWREGGGRPGMSGGPLRLVSFPPPDTWLNPPPPPSPPQFPTSFPLDSALRLVERSVSGSSVAAWEGTNSTVRLVRVGPLAWKDHVGGGTTEVSLYASCPVTARLEGADQDTTDVVDLDARFKPTGPSGRWKLTLLALAGFWGLHPNALVPITSQPPASHKVRQGASAPKSRH